VVERVRRAGRGPHLQQALGVVMVVTAVAMAFQLDVRFQSAIAAHLPAAIVNPTNSLERSGAVSRRLTELRPASKFAVASMKSGLRDYGPAPDFTGTQRWFNSAPLSLARLRGRVVLVDFWTYTCINCIRTLPHLEAWDKAYRKAGLTIVGVHTPEFAFEHEPGNVARAIRDDGIRYPVVQDNGYATWNAWGNDAWPAEYLIDARGHVRHVQFGEGDYAGTESDIRSLLREAGRTRLGADSRPDRTYDPSNVATPETYLGLARAQDVLPLGRGAGTQTFPAVTGTVPANLFVLGGTWTSRKESIEAGPGATIGANVTGKDVYLVLSPPHGGAGTMTVEVNGRHEKTLHVTGQRLYHLVSRPRLERGMQLRLRASEGVSAFAFTFG
jgi:thiol-disulfide isomerase/thioredoxin